MAHHWLGLVLAFTSIPAGLWMLVGAPLVEDAVFRYLLQDGLAKMLMAKHRLGNLQLVAGHVANALTSLVFVVAHPVAHTLMFQLWWLLPSLVLGELWRRYQRYEACAATHAWFNLCLWFVD